MRRNISRRHFLRLSAAMAGALLYGESLGRLGQQPRAAGAAESWEAYHGVTAADHQKNFDRLSGQGYRIISLSVYGDPSDPRYAAVWVQRSGRDWIAVHGVDGAGYQAFFDKQTAAGYVPVLVSATGTFENTVFAAVFEQGVTPSAFARHGMTEADFDSQNQAAAKANQYLRSVTIYGTAADRRYAAIWHANSQPYIRWFYHAADAAPDYQATFDLETKVRGYRPAYVALSDDKTYASVFTDQLIGPWSARHGMTADEYQTEFNKQQAGGNLPICVQGGGSGADTRYAAIFAQHEPTTDFDFIQVGDTGPMLSGFDGLMKQFMQTNGIRAGQLTLSKNGAIKHARAYTNRETGSGYRQTAPSDCFRLASCSKIFLEAAVQSLYDAGKLTTDTKVYPLLGFAHPADPRSDTITIQQLLDHQGGYDDSSSGSNFDPTYNMVAIAKADGLCTTVSKQDVIQYMYQRSLDFAPGAKYAYSNYGYLLAGAVVEKLTGQRFFDYVRDTLLKPHSPATSRSTRTAALG